MVHTGSMTDTGAQMKATLDTFTTLEQVEAYIAPLTAAQLKSILDVMDAGRERIYSNGSTKRALRHWITSPYMIRFSDRVIWRHASAYSSAERH